jgi:Leucine-rich repeat (LRR) protein
VNLDLSGNSLWIFHFTGFRSLQSIDLSNNFLKKISWKNCPDSLLRADFSHNRIKTITLKNASKNLTVLHLHYNTIRKIVWDADVKKLEVVDLRKNKISLLNWKDSPVNLKYLHLDLGKLFDYHFCHCRSENLVIHDKILQEYYDHHKKSPYYIPYLPLISAERKSLMDEVIHRALLPPNGFLYLEGVNELLELGLLVV